MFLFVRSKTSLVCLISGLHSAADTLSMLENYNSISLTVVICQNYWYPGNVKAKTVVRSICLCIPLLTVCLPVTARFENASVLVCVSNDALVNKEYVFLHQIRAALNSVLFALLCSALGAKQEKGQVSDLMPSLLLFLTVWVLPAPGSRRCGVFMVTRNISSLPHLPRSIRFWGWAFPVV